MLGLRQTFQPMFAHVAQGDLGGQLIAQQFGGRIGEQDLSAMRDRHHALRPRQRRIARVASGAFFTRSGLRRAGVQPHAHFDRSRMPRFVLQAALCIERGVERIAGRVERGAKGIADDLEDMAVVRLDRFMQNRMMAREEGGQFGRILLRQRGAALDVGEEEGDGAGG